MSITFNADEVLEIAEQIERNGANFYRRAAKAFAQSDAHRLLTDLASWEETHEKVFADMRKELSQREKEPVFFDPNNEAVMYLRAMADNHIFRPAAEPSEFFAGGESLEEVLRKAIQFEKDSVSFYLGMTDVVGESLGRDKVARIIQEEKRHVVMLNEKLAFRSDVTKKS
ncbi:MAG: ferritin family protein [Candidatus Coatesbacteria bacterium]|nr:ferritin family protein [Candidatus Coatesbacteria bacterium]